MVVGGCQIRKCAGDLLLYWYFQYRNGCASPSFAGSKKAMAKRWPRFATLDEDVTLMSSWFGGSR